MSALGQKRTRAGQLSTDLVQTRLILFAESGNVIPTPFLVVLVLWLVIIFASFSLFSDLNVTVFTCLSLFALSASCAIFLILELSHGEMSALCQKRTWRLLRF